MVPLEAGVPSVPSVPSAATVAVTIGAATIRAIITVGRIGVRIAVTFCILLSGFEKSVRFLDKSILFLLPFLQQIRRRFKSQFWN